MEVHIGRYKTLDRSKTHIFNIISTYTTLFLFLLYVHIANDYTIDKHTPFTNSTNTT